MSPPFVVLCFLDGVDGPLERVAAEIYAGLGPALRQASCRKLIFHKGSVAKTKRHSEIIRVPTFKKAGLFRAQDGVLCGLRDAELHHALRGDVDRFASGGIAANAGFAVNEHQFAQSGQRESVLGVLVREVRDGIEDFRRLFLAERVLVSDC